jgi:glycosyltransferase involved in cell wall biosynthesis
MGSSNGRRVVIMTPALMLYDAIGNDVRGMASTLRSAGLRVEVYAEYVHPDLREEASTIEPRGPAFWGDKEALLIYHHSMGWPLGQKILAGARCRTIVKHHNVTPPEFFEQYSPDHAAGCKAGEDATRQLAANRRAYFWADSQFNADDLMRQGAPFDRCAVLPPFHATEQLSQAAVAPEVIQSCREHSGLKILFVGGIKPNKGHFNLLRALAHHVRRGDPDAMLLLAGAADPRLKQYTEGLRQVATELHVDGNVKFVGSVTPSELRSYYMSADVFLCLSDHEGFCVPLLEAMYFRVPVVAHNCSAIGETLGTAGLVWDRQEMGGIAESLWLCLERDSRYRDLVELGWQRYHQRFSTELIRSRFLALVEEAFSRDHA